MNNRAAANCIFPENAPTGRHPWRPLPYVARKPVDNGNGRTRSCGTLCAVTTDVFRGSTAVRSGELTRTVLRGPRWRRLFRDVYLPAGVPVDHAARCRGAALLLPPGGALAGLSAATMWGVLDTPADAPVEAVVPPGVRFGPVKGLVVRTAELPPGDVSPIRRVPLTTPERTAWDLATGPDPVEAVAALDAFARTRMVDLRVFGDRVNAAAGRKGSRRARIALALADPRSAGPVESRLRVRLVLAGLPGGVPGYEVCVDGAFLARVCLAWPRQRVAVECDAEPGATGDTAGEAAARRFAAERERSNRLHAAGWLVLYATDDVPTLARQIQRALAVRAR